MPKKRKEIREAIKEKTGHDPHDNFTILENKKDKYKVRILWRTDKEEIIELYE